MRRAAGRSTLRVFHVEELDDAAQVGSADLLLVVVTPCASPMKVKNDRIFPGRVVTHRDIDAIVKRSVTLRLRNPVSRSGVDDGVCAWPTEAQSRNRKNVTEIILRVMTNNLAR
jgi:hypothetical protein